MAYGNIKIECVQCKQMKKIMAKGRCAKCYGIHKYGEGWQKARYIAKTGHGECPICGKVAKLVQDHAHDLDCSHKENQKCSRCKRGKICSKCNTGLGMFRDSVLICRAASEYLDFWYQSLVNSLESRDGDSRESSPGLLTTPPTLEL